MKKLLAGIFVTGVVGSVVAQNEKSENLIDCENVTEWTGKVLLNKKIKRNGEFSFETFGKYQTKTVFKEFIPVDPESTYTLTCYMRSLDPKQPASGYMGLYMYDEKKRLIAYNKVAFYPGTDSELVALAAKGSKEIVIKKNTKYLKYKDWVVAFNAKKNYADQPNFDLSPRGKDIIVDGDNLKLTLRFPLKKDYKAGTKIRLHSPWGAPFYWAAQGWMPGEWKKFSVTLKGIANSGTPQDKFWSGTKYVKPFFWFANFSRIPKPGARLLVDDFSFVKLK